MILPSFGALTGGRVIVPAADDAVFVTPGDALHCVR